MHEKQQLNYIFMLLSAIFVMPDSHFGAYFVKLDHSYEEMVIKWPSILEMDVPGFIPSQTNISFRVTKFRTKLFYSLILQKYISFFDNHSTVTRILNVREGYPHPQILTIAQKMANGDQYLLLNFCTTQIELKLNVKHKLQIYQ